MKLLVANLGSTSFKYRLFDLPETVGTDGGTELAKGKEVREINGEMYVLEPPLHGDFALVKAQVADRWGNLVYRKAARNFGPPMAMAGKVTIAQVAEIVPLGRLDPEHIVTPGIFVDRVVRVEA